MNMLPKAPDIPMPKSEDKDYMKVWHKYLQSDIDNPEWGAPTDRDVFIIRHHREPSPFIKGKEL